ncbi:MAG: type VI secretion system baseplate subunit TssG [Planctomycetales bacterium]|nr:type VI secretion system baseplate subunit TssG [Planctomycetales bacterium]
MASEDGAAGAAVEEWRLQELAQAPYKFDFYHAMRLLECVFRDAPRLGRSLRLADEPLRLSQEPSLKFAATAVANFQASDEPQQERLGVNFFGLCGPNGALPLHLTEYIRDRIRHFDDRTFAAFLDVFHHRLLTLFYRAWADAQPTVQFDRPEEDRYAVYLGALMGIGMPTLRDRDALPDVAKLYYAGRFACQTRHPEGLQAMLADFFQLPVSIDEFVGQWTELPDDCRFRTGLEPESATLGMACTLGSHVWDCQQKFRITVGPVDWDDFLRMLPGGDSLRRLMAMVRNYIGDELLWELNLVLKREETPSWELGQGQLGQSLWLDNAGVQEDPRDVTLQPEFLGS